MAVEQAIHPNLYLPPELKHLVPRTMLGSPQVQRKHRRDQRSVTPTPSIVITEDSTHNEDEPSVMETKQQQQASEPAVVIPNISLLAASFDPEEDTHL